MTTTERRDYLRCDCHDKQVMAERKGNRIIIKRTTHGFTHTLVLVLDGDGQPVVRMKCSGGPVPTPVP